MIPCDCGEPQAEFEDAVCRVFDVDGSRFEILDRNMISDPFEPDITLMDEDEWVLHLVCHYIEEVPDNGSLSIFPKTFGMRKWVTDSDDSPTFIIIGVGGTPANPEMLFFTRFYNISTSSMDISRMMEYSVNCFRLDFLDRIILKDFERMYSPS